VRSTRRPGLTAPARGARDQRQAGTEEQPPGTNRGTAPIRSSDHEVTYPVSRRGLREDKTRWRTGLPGACERWWPTWPIRGLSANENARALISMVARSTRSNQRPDTLMQDRRADSSTKTSCDARPDHTCGSDSATELRGRHGRTCFDCGRQRGVARPSTVGHIAPATGAPQRPDATADGGGACTGPRDISGPLARA
jgi:hypothetical protein